MLGAELVLEDLLPQQEAAMNALTLFRRINLVRDKAERITGVAARPAVIGVSVNLRDLILQILKIRLPADNANANEKWIFRVVNGDFFESDSGVAGGELDCINQALLRVSGVQVCRRFDGVSQILEQDLIRA